MGRSWRSVVGAVVLTVFVSLTLTSSSADVQRSTVAPPFSTRTIGAPEGEDWWWPWPNPQGGRTERYNEYPHVHRYARQPRPNQPGSQWSNYLKLTETIPPLRQTLNRWGGPFRVRLVGHDNPWSRKLRLDPVISRLKTQLPKLPNKHTLAIRSLHSGYLMWVRSHIKYVTVNIAEATDAIDRIYTALRWRFRDTWRNAGIYACRRINFSSSAGWSQHAWGNAMDIVAPPSVMFDISRWLANRGEQRTLPVDAVIYNRQQWSRNASFWHYYGGSNPHTNHVHVTGYPHRVGGPPCAA